MYRPDDTPGRATVLVVDDLPLNLVLVAGWLGEEHDVVVAATGEEALTVAEAKHPDVVVLDLWLPGIDGIETCRRLKQAASDEYLPVILLTAEGEQGPRNHALAAGADDFLRKPVDPDELRLRVRSFLTLRRQDALIRQQVVELHRLDRLKDDLVALVAHDLRNSLAGILALLEVSQSAGSVTASELDRVASAAKRMQETLEDIMRVPQLEEGVLTPRLAPAVLSDIVASALALVEPYAQARKVGLRVEGAVDTRCMVDIGLAQRALFNLLQNAVKFSPRGEAVTVRAAVVGDVIRLSVSDHGHGVSEASRARLFQKYGRAETREGFGMGLYLVQQVAHAHGGRVWVEAAPGGGSTFALELPLGTAA